MRVLLFISIFCMSLFAVNLSPTELQMLESAGYSKEMIESRLNQDKKKEVKKEQIVENNIKKEVLVENDNSLTNEDEVFTDVQKNQVKVQREKTVKLKRFASNFFQNENKIDPYSIPIPKDYKLTRADVISVTIFGSSTKDFSLKIDRKGNVTVPQVGDIKLLGLNFSEAKDLIINKSKEAYPSSTNIIVNIEEFSAIQVTLSGLVKNPGLFNLSSFSTIKDALILSGGILDSGSYRNIVLKRDGKVLKTFDLYSLVKYGNTSSDTVLQSGDLIFVDSVKKEIKLSGEVNIPSIYELKDHENFKKLLSLASGLKPSANKKAIRLKRYLNNDMIKVYTVSLKELYTMKPKNGDELYIYPISNSSGNLVTISGNVEIEGELELPKNRKLSSLLEKQISYFGEKGLFKKDTNYDYAIVENKKGKKTFNLKKVLNKTDDLILENGDNIRIFKINDLKNRPYFYAIGDVVNEESRKYDFYEGIKVKDIFSIVVFKNEINKDNIVKKELMGEKTVNKESFYVDRSKVQIRRLADNRFKTYTININQNPEFELKAYDEVTFFDVKKINDLMVATIKGEVFIPGTYDIDKNMTLDKLITIAGGFNKKALKTKFEIVRYSVIDEERVRKVMKLDMHEAINNKFRIKADDEITIFGIANWSEKEYVELKGEVRYPGKYAISKGEKLSSVIKRAGGFTSNAFLEGAVFTREEIKELQQKRLQESMDRLKRKSLQLSSMATEAGQSIEDKNQMLNSITELEAKVATTAPIGRVSLNLYYDMKRFEDSDFNITVKDQDSLYIPTVNDTVSVVGEVLNQNTFVYNRELVTEDYIQKAGGMTEVADEELIYIVKANGEAIKYEKSFFMHDNVDIFKGDTIVVPLKFDTVSDIRYAKDITSILYQLAVTAASLKTVGAF